MRTERFYRQETQLSLLLYTKIFAGYCPVYFNTSVIWARMLYGCTKKQRVGIRKYYYAGASVGSIVIMFQDSTILISIAFIIWRR